MLMFGGVKKLYGFFSRPLSKEPAELLFILNLSVALRSEIHIKEIFVDSQTPMCANGH